MALRSKIKTAKDSISSHLLELRSRLIRVLICLAVFVALLMTMPYFFYQIWMFAAPGLYLKEKSFLLPLMITSICLFVTGIAFAYYIVCPIIFSFFIKAAPESILVMTDISQYLNFILSQWL